MHFREAESKISRWTMSPEPPSVFAPLALDTIFAGHTLNCFRRACYYQWVTGNSMILCTLITQKDVSFFSRKECTFSIVQRYIFKDCWHEVRSSLKCTPPPPKKPRTRLDTSISLHIITIYIPVTATSVLLLLNGALWVICTAFKLSLVSRLFKSYHHSLPQMRQYQCGSANVPMQQ